MPSLVPDRRLVFRRRSVKCHIAFMVYRRESCGPENRSGRLGQLRQQCGVQDRLDHLHVRIEDRSSATTESGPREHDRCTGQSIEVLLPPIGGKKWRYNKSRQYTAALQSAAKDGSAREVTSLSARQARARGQHPGRNMDCQIETPTRRCWRPRAARRSPALPATPLPPASRGCRCARS